MRRALLAALVFTSQSCAYGTGQTAAVDAYLLHHFAGPATAAFYDKHLTASEPIRIPALQRGLPQTVFYRARLRGGSFDCPEVETLVACTRVRTKNEYKSCLGPVYEDVSPAFLSIFAGIHANTDSARERMARAITQLFASVTHLGRVGRVNRHGSTVEAELWHGHLMWRQVKVTFTASHTIKNVRLIHLAAPARSE